MTSIRERFLNNNGFISSRIERPFVVRCSSLRLRRRTSNTGTGRTVGRADTLYTDCSTDAMHADQGTLIKDSIKISLRA
ncbi:hypothetical protein TYRP_019924 [Tyrophagus putrescentiae]|nr:hypothetical protein TYRP_019924 [Tyrophagus putrescentiae]